MWVGFEAPAVLVEASGMVSKDSAIPAASGERCKSCLTWDRLRQVEQGRSLPFERTVKRNGRRPA